MPGLTTGAGAPKQTYAACSGCSLCLLVCPVWRSTRDLRYTPHGRAKALQHGATIAEIAPLVAACTLCGACEPVCPENIGLVDLVMDLRRALPLSTITENLHTCMQTERPRALVTKSAAATALLPGMPLSWNQVLLARTRASMGDMGGIAVANDHGGDIALALEMGASVPPHRIERFLAPLRQYKTVVVADGLLLRSMHTWLPDAEIVSLGVALSSHAPVRAKLRAGDLYVIEPRAYHADYEKTVTHYDNLRAETGCAMNLDLQRIAIPTMASSMPRRFGWETEADHEQLRWLLKGRKISRIVIENEEDRPAFEHACTIPVVHLAELMDDETLSPGKTSLMRTVDVIIVGASLAAAAAAKRLVDAGLETIVLERKSLPRHKICSGILSPRGHRFLLENFGPLPREALHEPTACRGVTFHFPSMVSMSMDFFGGTTPHLHRKYSDYWAITQSGAEIHDETSFAGLTDNGDHVIVQARKNGEPVEYRARQVIGADGPSSLVIRAIYPDYPKQIPWFFVGQKFHDIIDCPLSADYFHFWFHPGLGHYTWSHARDGRQIVGVGFKRGDNFARKHENVVNYLSDKHGVKLKPHTEDEGCAENFGPSLINGYVFGKGNVLITGQAAGFLNMIGEGMSCALHSGAISGEAIVEARLRNRPVQEMYRKMVASEVRRCSDQWNPLKIAFDRPHEADFPAALMALSWRDRAKVLRDMWRFIVLYKEFKWGRQIFRAAMQRPLLGGYSMQRWL